MRLILRWEQPIQCATEVEIDMPSESTPEVFARLNARVSGKPLWRVAIEETTGETTSDRATLMGVDR